MSVSSLKGTLKIVLSLGRPIAFVTDSVAVFRVLARNIESELP
jgi:hypothetical protein